MNAAGEIIKHFRQTSGVTQQQCADHLNISLAEYQDYEMDVKPASWREFYRLRVFIMQRNGEFRQFAICGSLFCFALSAILVAGLLGFKP